MADTSSRTSVDLLRLMRPALDAPAASHALYDSTPPGGRGASVRSWFNSAPVGAWREVLGDVAVKLVVDAAVPVRVLNGDESGTVVLAEHDGPGPLTLWVDLAALSHRWCWVELPGASGVDALRGYHWSVASGRTASAIVVIPTFGREDACREQVERILAGTTAAEVAGIVVVDQARTFADSLPEGRDWDRVTLVEQDNLGGSGGYARGLWHARDHDGPVVFLDDDAAVHPETLRRMIVLSSLAREPRLIGTALFAPEQPDAPVATAEVVDRRRFQWGAARPAEAARAAARGADAPEWAWDRGTAADYVGWWCAALPPRAARTIGYPAPYFLKWDDAEYGLRALSRGVRPTVVPGISAVHPAWRSDGAAHWSMAPLHRNRVATALAHGAGRGVLLDSLVHQVKHALSLQYDVAELWELGIADALGGPGWLLGDPSTIRARAEGLLAKRAAASERLGAAEPAPAGHTARAGAPLPLPRAALSAVLGLLRPSNPAAPPVRVDAFSWRATLGLDAALVGDPSTGTAVLLRRDPRRARALLLGSLSSHARLAVSWSRLAARYRRALPESSTEERWAARFAAAAPRERS